MTIDLTPPTPLWLASQGDLLDTHAMKVARSWLESGAWGLLMLGDVGRGKSQAAAWLWSKLRMQAIAEAQAPGVFRRPGDVIWLRARLLQRMDWGDAKADRNQILERCGRAYALVLDEIGNEDEGTARMVGDLVEQRGDQRRFTVMTTNLDGQSFLGRYGDRLTSRLRSGGIRPDGGARWAVLVQGEDLRSLERQEEPQEPDEPGEEMDVDTLADRSAEVVQLLRRSSQAATASTAEVTGRRDDDAAMRELQVRRVRGQLALDELEQRASHGCEASRAVLEAIDHRHQSARIPGHEDAAG